MNQSQKDFYTVTTLQQKNLSHAVFVKTTYCAGTLSVKRSIKTFCNPWIMTSPVELQQFYLPGVTRSAELIGQKQCNRLFIRQQEAALSLAYHSLMDLKHLLHQLIIRPTTFVPAPRKLLNKLSKLSIRAAQWKNYMGREVLWSSAVSRQPRTPRSGWGDPSIEALQYKLY